MAWSAPHTFTNGEVVSKATMDAVSDQFRAMMPHLAAEAGDTFFATAANALGKLSIGSPLSFFRLIVGLNSPVWGGIAFAQPPAFAYATDLVLKAVDSTSSASQIQSMTEIVHVTMTTLGGPVIVLGVVWVNEAKFGTGRITHTGMLTLDGETTNYPFGSLNILGTQGGPVGSGANASSNLPFMTLFQPPAPAVPVPNQITPGKHTWRLHATFDGDHTVTTVPCRANGTLLVMELEP